MLWLSYKIDVVNKCYCETVMNEILVLYILFESIMNKCLSTSNLDLSLLMKSSGDN